MKNVKFFDTPHDIRTYFENNKVKLIGSGAEGYAYLDSDNNVLKEIRDNCLVLYDDTIITSSDFNLESFIFPDELYVADDTVYGYKTKYFPNDVFCNVYREVAKEIDLLKLLEARKKAIEDIKVLTSAGFGIDDAHGNLLFDGEKLVLIDTLCYVKDYSSLDRNLRAFEYALDLKLGIIEPITNEWNMPFENKIKLLIRKNRSSKLII